VGKSCAGEFRHLAAGFEASPHPGGGAIEVRLPGAPSVPQQGGGETWWVYPGTATQWSFSEPWEGELQVFVEARSIGEGGGVLRLGEQAAPLQRAGRTWRATLNADEVRAPWLLAIEAAHDTWLALSQVTLGSDTPQRLVGAPPATLSAISSTFTAVTPPPIRAGTMIEDGGVAKIPLPGFEAVSDDATQALWGVPCSPVVVTSDGETWSTRHAPVRRVARTAKSSGHIGGFVYASLPGPHTLALDPRRTCDRSKRWIYPNDRVTFAQVPASARELRLGADLVRVVARSVGVPAELSVSVGVRGASPPPPVVHTLRVVQAREVFCLPIDPPMPPRANLDVAVRGDPAAFALLDQVQVGESEHMSCTPGAAP
jgi:hypothetical protein